jgi:hypothetical protein
MKTVTGAVQQAAAVPVHVDKEDKRHSGMHIEVGTQSDLEKNVQTCSKATSCSPVFTTCSIGLLNARC